MFEFTEQQMILPHEFFLPFGGKLNAKNQWCQLAAMIPWAEIEQKYAKSFKNVRTGQRALPVRAALGALIIQNRKGLSDRDTVQEIVENPYLQYFIGLPRFIEEPPFDASLMVHFRKRLGKDILNEINEMIARPVKKDKGPDDHDSKGGNASGDGPTTNKETTQEPENQGTLILDATCVPADIHYPTDIWLLNTVREALEEITDVLHKPLAGQCKKPRTYRNCARRDYLNIDKKKHKTGKEIRKAIGQQLRYIRRDLAVVESMATKSPLTLLNKRQYRNLLVSQEIYRQQLEMYQKRHHQTEDRIVSLHMPFIRPIVRGKTNADVEFGPKLSVSIVNGFTFMECLSFDAFNEGKTLIQSVENYRKRNGYYPKVILADKIYRSRDNLQFCKENHIRLAGPPLGRPTQDVELLRKQKREEQQDAGMRNCVEGKFGEGKRFYGLNRIMTHLRKTTETAICMQILVLNLEYRLRILLFQFFKVHFGVVLQTA